MKRKIKCVVVDVDGTMTDGGIYYDDNGNEQKKFSTRDAAGFFIANQLGIQVVVLTGRESYATEKRMKELRVDYLFQNIKDKKNFLKGFMLENNLKRDDVAYIGDDINDLSSMQLVGFVGCPKDSCIEVLEKADYISPVCGGHGVVRDVIEHLLRESGEWQRAISQVYDA